MSNSRMYDHAYDQWIEAREREDQRTIDNDLRFQQMIVEEMERAELEDKQVITATYFAKLCRNRWRK